MDWSEEDQKVAVSAASAMSLKRSFSGLDLAADARAARARRSAQPSNKEGLEDPTLETPLKDTGLPPSPDKTSPILNDLGPVALPRIGKKERFSKPCPQHCEAGRRAGPHQYLSKPFHCGCCVGTCELCDPAKDLWSPSFSPTTESDLAFGVDPFGDRAASEDLAQLESQPDSKGEPFYCELYPHCGCDPARDRFSLLDTPFAIRK